MAAMAAGWRLGWEGSGKSLQAIAVPQCGESGGLHQIEGDNGQVGGKMARSWKNRLKVKKEGQE